MKLLKKLFVFIVLIVYPIFGQVENLGALATRTIIPFFYFNALNFRDNDPNFSRLDVYIQVPYTQMTFLKTGEQYFASYEVTAGIYDSNGRIVNEKIWTEKITLNSYSESISRNVSNISQRSFRLRPGSYKLKITVQDKESKKSATAQTDVNVRAFQESFSLSDILLIQQYQDNGSSKIVIPNVTNNIIFADKGFYIFWEFYRSTLDSNFSMNCKVINAKGKTVIDFNTNYILKSELNPIFLRIDGYDFTLGEYIITITARSLDSLKGSSYSVSKRIFSRWVGIPKSITDLNKAIEQMIYIASREKINELLKIEDQAIKYEKFMDFWKDKDPTPGTEENELMDEYYGRVEYANQYFSNYQEGWKTDMGMVFIILGPPNNVERRPFNYNAPAYEIWEYYSLNRQFIFVDYTGFGDYRLVNRDFSEWFKYR